MFAQQVTDPGTWPSETKWEWMAHTAEKSRGGAQGGLKSGPDSLARKWLLSLSSLCSLQLGLQSQGGCRGSSALSRPVLSRGEGQGPLPQPQANCCPALGQAAARAASFSL